VSVGVSAHGTTSVHFVESAVNVDGQYYHKVLLVLKTSAKMRHSLAVRVLHVSTRP